MDNFGPIWAQILQLYILASPKDFIKLLQHDEGL